MVKNNIINILESMMKSLSLKAEYLKLEIIIVLEGENFLRILKGIDKFIEVNQQKLNFYNYLQTQLGHINKKINKYTEYITCSNLKMKNNILSYIQRHSDANNIIEEKFRHVCELNNKFPMIEELLENRLGF